MSSPIPDPIAPRNLCGHTVFSLTSRTRNWNSRCAAAFRAEFTASSAVFFTARTYAIRESEDSNLPIVLPGRTKSSEGGIGWIPFYLDRSDRHYTNQKWLRRDFGDKLPSDVFREHSLACYVTDKTSLKLRREIGIDNIAWECDYPHSDCFWPDAPEQVLAELTAAGADDGDINKITWENACNFFSWDPFARTPREQANVGALRAKATDVDVSIRPRKEWARLYAEKQLEKA